MRSNYFRSFLAFLLKFLNFLQTFVGVSIIIYSAWMLNQWNKHSQNPLPSPPPPPSAPSPELPVPLLLNSDMVRVFGQNLQLNLAAELVSGLDDGLQFELNKLPAPWFIYSFMGVGILLCSITCIGHIAAESVNGCCLCFYTLLKTILILLEAALVAFIVFVHSWEKELPYDPTGELDNLRSFILNNIDICKWVGITMVTIQAMVSTRRRDYDSDDDYAIIRGRTRQPLLNPQISQTTGSTSVNSKGTHSDIWSTRMREKYGLNSTDAKCGLLDQNSPLTSGENQKRCSIM
uniref:Tetraspanin-18 n=1 Tax=Nelumbo nucifera TaxID=4432 RepID=A0A822XFA0_NELNU|nr:TPA_asm: hypothetical protein HUJ06_021607 [Nelumbo nucifera]